MVFCGGLIVAFEGGVILGDIPVMLGRGRLVGGAARVGRRPATGSVGRGFPIVGLVDPVMVGLFVGLIIPVVIGCDPGLVTTQ